MENLQHGEEGFERLGKCLVYWKRQVCGADMVICVGHAVSRDKNNVSFRIR